jgi:hypothetical protein
MDRAELERLDRDALIRRAEKAGISRPSILTRPELVDELLVRSAPRADDPTLRKVRGFFGLARDLLASVIDRGLHLPDAAERIRALRGPPPPAPARTAPNVLPTVTLAEIYATQGHRERAVDTLRRVIEREPEHAAARSLLDQLEDASYPVPAPPLPPEEEEETAPPAPSPDPDREATAAPSTAHVDDAPNAPSGVVAPPAERSERGVGACVAIPVDPVALFVWWEVDGGTLGRRQETAPGGALTVRLLIVVPTWEGPLSSVRDLRVEGSAGERVVRDLPVGAVVRAAIGWGDGEAFVPVAHSPLLTWAPGTASPAAAETLLRWTPHVGSVPVASADRDAASIARAAGRLELQQRGGGRSTNSRRVAT